MKKKPLFISSLDYPVEVYKTNDSDKFMNTELLDTVYVFCKYTWIK